MNSVSFCVRIASSGKLVISLIYTWILIHSYCQTVCLTDPSNNQLVKDEGAQIFYSIRSQTKPIGIGVNCEIPHNVDSTTRTYNQALIPLVRPCALLIHPTTNWWRMRGAQIFYSIWSQTKPIGIWANCEIPHSYSLPIFVLGLSPFLFCLTHSLTNIYWFGPS